MWILGVARQLHTADQELALIVGIDVDRELDEALSILRHGPTGPV